MAPIVALVPTVVWTLTPELLMALDERFGEPVDAYVNGSQVWLRPDGPAAEVIEWRLHPVAGFQRPPGSSTDTLFSTCALAVATGELPVAPINSLWDGLEAFIAYDEDVEPPQLLASTVAALGLPATAWGLVDHDGVADRWARSAGQTSIINELLEQLQPHQSD